LIPGGEASQKLMNQDHIFYFMILMVNSLFGLLLAEWPLLAERYIPSLATTGY